MLRHQTIASLTLFLTPTLLFAAGSDEKELLTIGGGISAPSLIATTGNPAGFTANRRSKLAAMGSFSTTTGAKNPQSYAGGFFSGNGKMGGGVQVTRYETSNTTSITPGLGFDISSLKSSLGVLCSYSSTGGLSCNNFGIHFDPNKSFRLGGKIVTGSTSPTVSAGLAIDPTKNVTLSLDGTRDFTYKSNTATLAGGLYFQETQWMASYTFYPGNSTSSGGTYLYGMGWIMSKGVQLIAYSNLSNSHSATLLIGL